LNELKERRNERKMYKERNRNKWRMTGCKVGREGQEKKEIKKEGRKYLVSWHQDTVK
jgi:hypothetical protein